ncbi:MAG: putative DNA binding domain-containing protein [Chitinispirillales bacterium]|nr:putative DNA binding domain-containing protein [Chitinispirillales bacterium]
MDAVELLDIIRSGETGKVQFKREFDNQDKIAAEMIAMSNAMGGIIIFGVEDKTGIVVGLDYAGLRNTGSRVATIANELVKPAVYIVTEVVSIGGGETEPKNVLLVHIDEGQYKPYKDTNGTIWIKQGADKRKLTDNNEQIRLFQQSGVLSVDEMPVADTAADDIDKAYVDEYVESIHLKTVSRISDSVLYQNLIIIKNSKVTLGGLLFFGKEPQRHKPAFCVKAISFVGNSIGGLSYRDSRDITGTIPNLFKEGMLFFKQNLKHVQRGQNFNKLGILEISEIALEEVFQNALVHRDYSKNSSIRLMIFDNRVEIVSPGCLPNSLTVENIKVGNMVIRNNLLASYCSKLMIYRGFGSGIVRALEEQPNIEFVNDVEGEQFVVKIPREQTL